MSEPETDEAQLRAMPRRTPVTDDAYRILREALITSMFSPGQRLSIEQLAQELNVSITPVRHALARLESEGFVTRLPYKGYAVSDLLDPGTVAEIFEARTYLETATARKVAGHLSPDDAEFLTTIAALPPQDRFVDPNADGGDPDGAGINDGTGINGGTVINDGALHRRIATIAGNKTVVDLLDQLNERIATYRSFVHSHLALGAHWRPAEHTAATMREHAAIVRALVEGDAEKAAEAMREHLTNASKRDITSAPAPADHSAR